MAGTSNNTANAQNTVQYDLSGVEDPTIFAVQASPGSTYRLLRDGAPKFYIKIDEGLTTNWLDISGAITGAINVGTGAQVLKNIVLGILQLRTIKGSGGITVLQNANDIEIVGTSSNAITNLDCDSSVNIGDLVIYVGATLFKPSDNANATMPFGIVGLVTNKTTAVLCDIILTGKATGFSGLTGGSPLFVSASGGLTQTAPLTGTVQLLGFAINATDILFQPKQPLRRS